LIKWDSLHILSMVPAVNEEKIDRGYLGRVLDKQLMAELAGRGIDIAGESGEYHTVVIDGPLFKQRIELKITGLKSVEQHCFLDLD